MNIYVGKLPYQLGEGELTSIFEPYGAVSSVSIIKDRETGNSKGFGFVIMDNDQEAETAINELNDSTVEGRKIIVNEARPREPRPKFNNNRRPPRSY